MVTFGRTQWPQTHRTFDSWIILWNAIGETGVLVFITSGFFGIWRVSILLHIIPRSFGVVHCHYESLEWIIYFLRKSEVFSDNTKYIQPMKFSGLFWEWLTDQEMGRYRSREYQEEAGFSQPSYHNLGFLSEKPYILDCNYCKQKIDGGGILDRDVIRNLQELLIRWPRNSCEIPQNSQSEF